MRARQADHEVATTEIDHVTGLLCTTTVAVGVGLGCISVVTPTATDSAVGKGPAKDTKLSTLNPKLYPEGSIVYIGQAYVARTGSSTAGSHVGLCLHCSLGSFHPFTCRYRILVVRECM